MQFKQKSATIRKSKKRLHGSICVLLMVLTVIHLALPSAAQGNPYIPDVSAQSAILIHAKTGTVLYEKNARAVRAIASTTKIMTTLITLESGDLDAPFQVDDHAIKIEGTSMGLREGDIVTKRILCYGMMLPSGNDAANAAAVQIAGSTQAFAERMNARAKEIGMQNTNFVNPHGLDADNHSSTAYDMALLTAEALKNPLFREICGEDAVKLEFGNPPYTRWLTNNNKLLHMYDGCIGVKTGFTDAARRCLVSAAGRDGAELIAVTLNAPNDWKDHASLFDYGFGRVKPQNVLYDTNALSIPVVSGDKQTVRLQLEDSATVCLTDEEYRSLVVRVSLKPFLYGGFAAGEYAGNLLFYYQNTLLGTARLVTAEPCASLEPKQSTAFDWFG